jgi:hypothetical protein
MNEHEWKPLDAAMAAPSREQGWICERCGAQTQCEGDPTGHTDLLDDLAEDPFARILIDDCGERIALAIHES